MKIRSILALALVALAPAVFAADFGVRAGQYRDADEQFVGVEMLVDTGVLNINPNIEYSLQDDVTAGTANLDVTFDVGTFSSVTPYLGAGVGLAYFDDDFGTDETNLVGNLIGGVALRLGTLKPYVQAKYFRVLENDDGEDDIAVTLGLRF